MDRSSMMDTIYGKHYNLPLFENDLVQVESYGRVIRVGIKNDNGVPFSWWEPTHPFKGDHNLSQQNGWNVRIKTINEEEIQAIFTKGKEEYTLKLICMNPNIKPKPIHVSWD